jgi:hypothetical protein
VPIAKLSYESQWRTNRRDFYLLLTVIISWFVVAAVTQWVRADHSVPGWVLLAWSPFIFWSALRYNPKCPRCGNSLTKPPVGPFVFFARKCPTCGLPRGARSDPAAGATYE